MFKETVENRIGQEKLLEGNADLAKSLSSQETFRVKIIH